MPHLVPTRRNPPAAELAMPGPVHAVTARAGCRVDLAGGTLDIWPLCLLHERTVTTNVAIDVPVEVEVRRRSCGYSVSQGESRLKAASLDELRTHAEARVVAVVAQAMELGPVDVMLSSASPRGGGLGASSSLMVCLIACAERLAGDEPCTAVARARLAQDLEARLVSLPTGSQDFFPPQLGGALALEHLPGGTEWSRLAADLDALDRSLLVVYSGQSHFSAAQNWEVVRKRLDAERTTVERFEALEEISTRAPGLLEGGDFEALGRLLSDEWSVRRQLADGLSTPAIETILRQAGELGAWGGKVCGAGGGGCVALLCPPEKRQSIADGLTAVATRIDARPRAAGLEIVAT